MDQKLQPAGTIITFYSFKGGTGRSMAAANIACLLAKDLESTRYGPSPRILLIDWDLEAPGLHRYFQNARAANDDTHPGLIDYFISLFDVLTKNPGASSSLLNTNESDTHELIPKLEEYIVKDVVPGVDLLKAGRFDSNYPKLVSTFDWAAFYAKYTEALTVFREIITSSYSYCLIDARTGYTDTSGICTMILPQKIAGVFTPNQQSLSGLIELVRRAVNYRRLSNDFRPLAVFPIPSRIDPAEQTLRKLWRDEYQSQFETLFCEVYDMKECNLKEYFDTVQLPHMSYYAYGEKIAVQDERSDSLSLTKYYEDLYERLIRTEFPCESSFDILSDRGPQCWEKKLSATDAQRQIGNPTGDIRLTKAEWKVDGKPIDQTRYFRIDLFGGFDWFPKGNKVEQATIPFEVTILGKKYGRQNLIISHKPSGEAGQHNYTTGIQWGPLASDIRELNLTGKLLRMYEPPLHASEPYFIDII